MGVCALTGKYCQGQALTCGLFNVSSRSNSVCYWYRERQEKKRLIDR